MAISVTNLLSGGNTFTTIDLKVITRLAVADFLSCDVAPMDGGMNR